MIYISALVLLVMYLKAFSRRIKYSTNFVFTRNNVEYQRMRRLSRNRKGPRIKKHLDCCTCLALITLGYKTYLINEFKVEKPSSRGKLVLTILKKLANSLFHRTNLILNSQCRSLAWTPNLQMSFRVLIRGFDRTSNGPFPSCS